MPKRLFRYSGNKGRMLQHYRPPPRGCSRIVEPYLGSSAYSLNHDLPALGYDTDPNVVALWHWLQEVGAEELRALGALYRRARSQTPKFDIRELGLSQGAELYLKINVCSLVVGQWSSWTTYPQHELPIRTTLRALCAGRRVRVEHGDGSKHTPLPGDLLFVDPPYRGTSGNYVGEDSYSPAHTLALIEGCSNPVVFTYGSTAPETFPGLPWEVVSRRRVPNMRSGGTVERLEHVAYLNWPPEDVPLDVFSFFGA